MTETSLTEELKRYIFDEMSEDEREILDARFFQETGFFNEYAELEDDLTDRYVSNLLTGEDLRRFEQSLKKNPARREKLNTARALQQLAAEERKKTPAPIAAPTFWGQISSFFTWNRSAAKFAAAALILLLVCGGGFLVYRERQQEFAEIETRKEAERIERENRLRELERQQRGVEEERRQNQQNQTAPDNSKVFEQQNTNAPVNLLENEINAAEENRKKEIERRKRELEDSRRKSVAPPSEKIQPPQPIITTVLTLIPTGTRGETDDVIINIDKTTEQVIFKVNLPEEIKGKNLSVKLNGATLPSSVRPLPTKNSKRVLSLKIPARKLKDNLNIISIGNYEAKFYIKRK